MSDLRKRWGAAKKKFESLDLGKLDPKKYLSKKDLGPTLDKAEAAYDAMQKKDDDPKLAKACYDLSDAAVVIASLYERELVFLGKEIAKTDKKTGAEIVKIGDVLAAIVIEMSNARQQAKDVMAGVGDDDKNALIRKAIEKGIKAVMASLKAVAASPDMPTWNEKAPPAIAALVKTLQLSGKAARAFDPVFGPYAARQDPAGAGPDLGRAKVIANIKAVQAGLKKLADSLDTYLPK